MHSIYQVIISVHVFILKVVQYVNSSDVNEARLMQGHLPQGQRLHPQGQDNGNIATPGPRIIFKN